jgi:hypothetical protein
LTGFSKEKKLHYYEKILKKAVVPVYARGRYSPQLLFMISLCLLNKILRRIKILK